MTTAAFVPGSPLPSPGPADGSCCRGSKAAAADAAVAAAGAATVAVAAAVEPLAQDAAVAAMEALLPPYAGRGSGSTARSEEGSVSQDAGDGRGCDSQSQG